MKAWTAVAALHCTVNLYIPHGSDERDSAVNDSDTSHLFISHMVQMKEQ